MTGLIGRTLLAAVAVASLAGPAAAQGITIGPNGVTIDDGRRDDRDRRGPPPGFRDDRRGPPDRFERRRELSEREAVRIARAEGLRDVDDVVRTRSTFRVEGVDRRGDDMLVIVDRRSGRVVDVR